VTIFSPLFASIESPQVSISSAEVGLLFGGETVSAGVQVTEEKALGLPAVFRAVNVVAGTIASLPIHAFRDSTTGARTPVASSHPAAKLLATPHPDMTQFELWETVLTHMILWGNAYMWLRRDRHGKVVELWPIHPSRMRAGRTSDLKKVYKLDGGDVELDDTRILHLPAFGYDGVCGVSPVRLAREGLGLAIAAEQYGAKLFGSGSLATGVLQTDQRLTQDQADALQVRWRAKRSGLNSAHETIVLDAGAKWTQLSIPPGDAQFLESRSFQVSEIARMFGVPPHMLMDTEKVTSWGTGIEQQSIGFVVYTLRTWIIRIEQRLSRILSPQPVYAHITVEGLLRGDSAQRAAFYKQMFDMGAYNTDEIRALEEMGPVPGGDVRYRPLNMGVLGTTDDGAADA